MTELPILDADAWINVIDNTEQGEPIPAPLGLTPFMRGAVTVLGAETSVGKTAFGLQSFRWVIDNRVPAIYATLEMSPALLFKRFWPQFGSEDACRLWIESNDATVSHSYLNNTELEQIIRTGDYPFVVIDHIHELPFEGHEDLARKVHRLGSLAPETNTAILMLSQMKQRDRDFDDGPPTLQDYSWTKAISEVGAICWALWQPDVYDPYQIEFLELKNRFGAVGPSVDLSLNRETITFERARATWR